MVIGNLKVTFEDLNIIIQSLNGLTIKGSDAVRLAELIGKVDKCGLELKKKQDASDNKAVTLPSK
tara:strand:+ start:10261 stop:10455 length:195 start_codon:yes stop_codon:yes gene_type:complete